MEVGNHDRGKEAEGSRSLRMAYSYPHSMEEVGSEGCDTKDGNRHRHTKGVDSVGYDMEDHQGRRKEVEDNEIRSTEE